MAAGDELDSIPEADTPMPTAASRPNPSTTPRPAAAVRRTPTTSATVGSGALTGRHRAVALPNPEPLLNNLARGIVEAIGGMRELEQISRWVAPEVYTVLLQRTQHAARARAHRGVPTKRLNVRPIACHWQSPREGVVEAAVVIDLGSRSRAVSIRLEEFRGRWRAERLTVL